MPAFQETHYGDWAGDIPAAITKCNQAIFDLGGEDENNAEQEALIAPALAMRAFYHFIFMDTFGATPKLDHLIGDSEAIDRSPRSEITKIYRKRPASCFGFRRFKKKMLMLPLMASQPNGWLRLSLPNSI